MGCFKEAECPYCGEYFPIGINYTHRVGDCHKCESRGIEPDDCRLRAVKIAGETVFFCEFEFKCECGHQWWGRPEIVEECPQQRGVTFRVTSEVTSKRPCDKEVLDGM